MTTLTIDALTAAAPCCWSSVCELFLPSHHTIPLPPSPFPFPFIEHHGLLVTPGASQHPLSAAPPPFPLRPSPHICNGTGPAQAHQMASAPHSCHASTPPVVVVVVVGGRWKAGPLCAVIAPIHYISHPTCIRFTPHFGSISSCDSTYLLAGSRLAVHDCGTPVRCGGGRNRVADHRGWKRNLECRWRGIDPIRDIAVLRCVWKWPT